MKRYYKEQKKKIPDRNNPNTDLTPRMVGPHNDGDKLLRTIIEG